MKKELNLKYGLSEKISKTVRLKEAVNWSEVSIEDIVRGLIGKLENDLNREGLRDTPMRVSKFYSEWFQEAEPQFPLTTFDAEGYADILVVRNVPFFSMCEHHLLPFFGHASVAYVPKGSIIGLSKLPRIIKFYASRLQNQERLTNQISQCLMERLNPSGAAVTITARHLCTEMRGVCSVGNETITSSFKGIFENSDSRRDEYYRLIQLGK